MPPLYFDIESTLLLTLSNGSGQANFFTLRIIFLVNLFHLCVDWIGIQVYCVVLFGGHYWSIQFENYLSPLSFVMLYCNQEAGFAARYFSFQDP